MKQDSSLTTFPSLQSRRWSLIASVLLLGFSTLSLIGWSVRAGGQESDLRQSAWNHKSLMAASSAPAITAAPANTIIVNTADDGAPIVNGKCTLREAIINANNNDQSGSIDCPAGSGADTILFTLTSGPQVVNLTGVLPNITDSISIINSTGPANLTVRRDTGGDYRIFNISKYGLNISITGLTISDGYANDSPNYGGGILSHSYLALTDCIVTNNVAGAYGGGIYLQGNGQITNCTISNNQSAKRGGGIYFMGATGGSGALTMTNVTISGNSSQDYLGGGGIHAGSVVTSTTLNLTNCTVANNMATYETAGNPGAGGLSVSGDPTTVTLTNTIFADNTLPNIRTVFSVGVISAGGNLMDDGGNGFLIHPTDQINQNSLLAALGNYGGLTPTHALLPGSPAINAGISTNAPPTDQRGVVRVGAVDSGAFESRGFNLAVNFGNNQSAHLNTVFTNPLIVFVSSDFGEPVTGGEVTFTPPAAGASAMLAPNPAPISANNRANVTATAINQAGNYLVTASANGGNSVNFLLTNIQCQAMVINPVFPVLPQGTAGQAYSQTFTQTGGVGTITWSVISGSLPGNLTLNPSTGALTGSPTTFGNFNFTLEAKDFFGCKGNRAYLLTIQPPCAAVTVNPETIPNGNIGAPYNVTLTATGGAAPYTFTLSAGILPDGLSLNTATGEITGQPVLPGLFTFTVKATGQNNCFGTRHYNVAISGGTPASGLQFYPLAAPVRLLDTRPGASPNACNQPGAPIAGGTSRLQPGRGFCSIPANAQALIGNITTVQSGGGYLTLYPSDAQQPLAANSNYAPNEILNNVFTVGLGANDGAFKIFVTSNTHVVIDITGYYAPPAFGGLYFHPLPKPIRLLETRDGESGCFTPGTQIVGGLEQAQIGKLTCNGVTIPASAKALVGNATTLNSADGFLTLYPGGQQRPLVASSNFRGGQIMNAPFTVGLGTTGEFMIYSTTNTDLVIDVLGYYSDEANDLNGAGLLFHPLPHPVRLLETRAGEPGCHTLNAPLHAGFTHTQQARGQCGGATIANTALAIVGNATVVNNQAGYLTFWPNGTAKPLVATTNFPANHIFNRHFTVGLGVHGSFNIFSLAQTDLVIDLSGYFAP